MAPTARRRTASPARARKRSSRSKAGPRVSDLILKAVAATQEPKGLSLVALKKALAGYGYDVKKNNSRVKLALRSLVKRGLLVQTEQTEARRQRNVSKRNAVKKRPGKTRALKKSKAARSTRATKSAPRRAKGRRSRAKKHSAKRVTMSRRTKVKAAKRKGTKRKSPKVRSRRAARKK